jgi:hypothetical protein
VQQDKVYRISMNDKPFSLCAARIILLEGRSAKRILTRLRLKDLYIDAKEINIGFGHI